MRIRKYDFNYGRRQMMEKTLKGAGYAGVLGSMWPMVSRSDSTDIQRAYPEEQLSIAAATKGKLKHGDMVTADNVDYVKDMLDPITYWEVKNDGRKFTVGDATTDIHEFFEDTMLQSTLANMGTSQLDDDLNMWYKGQKGVPAKGGIPFPDPQTGAQAQANINFSWGRHNYSQYAIRDWDIGPDGEVQYQYDFVWCELQVTVRPDDTIWHNQKDMLRYQSVFFTAPNQQAGTSFLSQWYYDQTKFPALLGYLPAFKRVREYPANQRFEPLVPGITVFLSNAWAAGDPMGTWGNYKIVDRKPMLGAVQSGWYKDNPNWEIPVHGGPKGQTYFDDHREMCPECLVVDFEPTSYPRSPVGKRRNWFDSRSGMFITSVDYDRKGKVWKLWDAGFQKKHGLKTGTGETLWTWCWVMCHDVQANRMSRLYQAEHCSGGYESQWNTPEDDVAYNKYLTSQAMRRLGA
ncbi:MAG: DUF1329 domain-containing protein [Salinisphaera sp.]|nr:DUF1329 domain-containing protein [Salinisphaera sp.]